MSRSPFLLTASLATLAGVLLSACPAGAGGPHGIKGVNSSPYLRSQRAVQEPAFKVNFEAFREAACGRL